MTLPPAPGLGYLGFSWSYGKVGGCPNVARPSDANAAYPMVCHVNKCSPAANAGLRAGDVLMVVDGQDGSRIPLFGRGVDGPGTVHVIAVRRGEELLELTMTSTEPLGREERPEDRCEGDKPLIC